MGFHHLLLIVVPFISISGVPTTGLQFNCPLSIGYFPDLEDCSKFFLCQKNVAYQDKCQPGAKFDAPTKRCIFENPTCAVDMDYQFECPEPLGFFPHQECNMFYQCQNYNAYLDRCPSGQSFDLPTRQCLTSADVSCDEGDLTPDSKFKCPFPLGYFSNLEDCGKFFVCQNFIAYQDSCKSGMQFDAPERKCVTGKAICADEIDSDFQCPKPLGFYPHKDCRRFHQCQNRIAYVDTCPLGKSFDIVTSNCVERSEATCLGDDERTDLPFKCPIALGYFPNLEDCSKFFLCYKNTAHQDACTAGMQWDAPNRRCVTSDATCAGQMETTFKCPKSLGFFPHEDLQRFYQCQRNVAYLDKCPPWQSFDASSKICVKSKDDTCLEDITC